MYLIFPKDSSNLNDLIGVCISRREILSCLATDKKTLADIQLYKSYADYESLDSLDELASMFEIKDTTNKNYMRSVTYETGCAINDALGAEIKRWKSKGFSDATCIKKIIDSHRLPSYVNVRDEYFDWLS